MSTKAKKVPLVKAKAKKIVATKVVVNEDIYSNVKDIDGKLLVTPNRLYELNNLLNEKGLTSEQLLTLLRTKSWQNWTEFVYYMKTTKEFETKRDLEYELLLNKTAPSVYSEPCRKCNSSNTKIVGKQERSADEGGTARVLCNVCGFNSVL